MLMETREPLAFTIRSSDVDRCPIRSLSPTHYRDDGTCTCPPKEDR